MKRRLNALCLLLLAWCGVSQAQTQGCPAGTYRTFSALSGQSGASQTLVNNSNTFVGDARLQVSNTATGSASFTNNSIDANHYAGEPGIRIGQDNTSASAVLVTALDFRDPGNLAAWRPLDNLTLRLHDVDAGDNVIVNAYDQNGALIALSAANYSFNNANGTPFVSYAGNNRFTSAGGDSPSNQRRGTVNLSFVGQQVRRIEFRYYDTTSSGTYTIAELMACSVPVTVSKVTTPIAGGPFAFSLTNTTLASSTVTTTVAGTPVQVDGNAAAGLQPFTVTAPGTAVAITESSLPTGWSLVDAVCTNAAGTTVGSRSGNVYTIPAANTVAGEVLACTFSNSRTTLRLQKALPAGRAQAADQFTLAIAGTGAPAAVTTTGSGTTANGLVTHATPTAGSSYTLSESAAGGTLLAAYTATYSCTNARPGGQTPSGSGTSFSVVPAAGDDLTCTFRNAVRRTDLVVVKTATPSTAPSGSVVAYTVVVTNNGPTAAPGTVLADVPSAGLDCTAPSTTFACTASGGATCPSPTVPVATLLGAGMTIPVLPSGGQVTATLSCTVTASGLP